MYTTEIKKKKKDNDIIRGVIAGDKAYCGPRLLQLDITNNCNVNCVGCWCHSDALGDAKLSNDKKKEKLSYKIICKIIDDVARMGTEGVQLAGSGEPLLHPDIIKIIDYIKSKDLALEIVTNGILLNKDIRKAIISSGVEQLTLSIWAGTEKTYVKTHPNQAEVMFGQIRANLIALAEMKKRNAYMPMTRMYHVISAYNYHEINEMINYALQCRVNRVEFQTIDIIPKKTEFLRLTEKHVRSLEKQFDKVRKRKDLLRVNKFDMGEFNEFGRVLFEGAEHGDFTFYFNHVFMYGCKCFMGEENLAVSDNTDLGIVTFCFDKNICECCVRRRECSIDKKTYEITLSFLSLVGVNTFLRRIRSNMEKSTAYDKNLVNMPCYAGWDYARILTNGDVAPCCKGHKNPFGNIFNDSFEMIWNSEGYNEFRQKGKEVAKDDPYFKPFNCTKGCDNYGRNAAIGDLLRIHRGEECDDKK